MPLMRDFVFWLSNQKAFTQPVARTGMRLGFARRFVAGETLEEGLQAAVELNAKGLQIILNRLGENVTEKDAAREVCGSYKQMLQEIADRKIDGSISIKPTQLGLDFGLDFCRDLTLEVVAEAARLNNFVEVDMESTAYTQATVDLFEAVRRQHDNVGLAVQSYLYRTEEDLRRLMPLKPKIRLVKGAYREPPNLAFPKKKQVDENFGKLMRMLFADGFVPAVATHDEKMIDLAKVIAKESGRPADQWEFQMIYGVGRQLQLQLPQEGYRMRVYVPYGTEWLPYFLRRLSERPANLWFVIKNMLKGG
jgi:proline dehydrogenase